MTRNIKLIIEYDGTNYCGWQCQTDAATVQGYLQKSILKLTGEKITVHGSGRTDSGVHARHQVANFFTSSKIPDFAFAKALNSFLPSDIVVKLSQQVAEDFHAQFSACGKVYCYRIYQSSTRPAIDRNYVHWVWCSLDIELMREGACYLLGEHNFSSFEAANSPRKSNVRIINSIDIQQTNCYIEVFIKANGFLYKMARNIVGTLIQVGCKKIPPVCIKKILEAKNRNLAGPTAPAKGLFLENVIY